MLNFFTNFFYEFFYEFWFFGRFFFPYNFLSIATFRIRVSYWQSTKSFQKIYRKTMPQFWSVTIMILIQFWLELQALDHFFVAFHQCLVFLRILPNIISGLMKPLLLTFLGRMVVKPLPAKDANPCFQICAFWFDVRKSSEMNTIYLIVSEINSF